MTRGEKIRRERESRRLTRVELAKLMGLRDPSAVSHWEKGRFSPSRESLGRLCQIFEKPVSYFEDDPAVDPLARSKENLEAVLSQSPSQMAIVHVGVRGTVSAENFRMTGEDSNPEEWLPIVLASSPQSPIFALRVRGDCMLPTARDGDFAIVEKNSFVDKGHLAVLRLDDHYTLKRVFFLKDGMMELRPDNPKFKSLRVPGSEVSVCGKVIGFFHKVQPAD